jgi:preprotein translocase subunit SecA
MLQNIGKILGGDPHKKELKKLVPLIEQINALEKDYESLSDEALRAKTDEFKARLSKGETLDELLPEAFAAVREASKRTLGLRHYDVQMIGGITLHKGKIAEMKTGEGKTLAATLPLYLNALAGRGAHLVTVNDYLARRDARWMAPIYFALGLTVGVLQMASRTENGKKAFIVDFSKESPHEDQNQLSLVEREDAYKTDITYGTNSEFGFDYLRDNLAMRLEERVQRGHAYGIVDEVDNILIDEARTPLIISGPAQDEAEWYIKTAQVVRQLRPEDYEISEKDRTVALTEMGEAHCEELLDMPLRDPERPEDITTEQARMLGYLMQSLRAQFLFRRNKDYLVQAGKVVIVDEFTGRLMPGRRWSEGLHQAVEAKEGAKVEPENITYATITLQNYFRMYEKLAGMTGTALTEAEEFYKIYKLDILPIPTNLEFVAMKQDAELGVFEDRDEEGYRYSYYANRNDTEKKAVFWRRKDYPDQVYRTEEAKLRAITLEILRYHVIGRPQLVGTTSVEHSERLSDRLQAEPLRRLAQTVLVRNAWLEKNTDSSAETDVKELRYLNKPVDQLNIGEMRQMGRTLGIVSMNPDDPENISQLIKELSLNESDAPRLVKALQAGVPHQVLNARKHDEEAQIIARAGAFGAVTIATNMAGRGVDIKLGGQLPDEVNADVIHVLSKAGFDPYDQTPQAMRGMLDQMPKENWSIHEPSIQAFYQYLEDMKRVRELGGLHVIGSERHEARRIDNQLRGRSARQGDPGSSRFYLSLEDELMRMFGGNRAEALMKVFNIDPSIPIESSMLGRLVEQAQERVEGYNFDARKHLLEYDDVLNEQRKRIYSERDSVFTEAELRGDVLNMLRTELKRRVPQALEDSEGPWKLLAYLEEIQPTIYFEPEKTLVSSYTLRLTLDALKAKLGSERNPEKLKTALLELAKDSLQAEKVHLMDSAKNLIDKTEETFESQRREKEDTLDAYFDSLRDWDETEQPKRPQEMLDELTNMLHVPVKLAGDSFRDLPQGSREVKEELQQQVDATLLGMDLTRLVGAFERRLDDSLGVSIATLSNLSWDEAAKQLLAAVETNFDKRSEKLIGAQGMIAQNIGTLISRQPAETDQDLQMLLMLMAHGVKMTIDTHTHKRGWRRIILLNYIYTAASELQTKSAENATNEILSHLEDALEKLKSVWGQIELERLMQMGATLPILVPGMKARMEAKLGAEKTAAWGMTALAELKPEERKELVPVLGEHIQNEICRQILLGAISELWIDYLTRMEALRVSIGLESYAQRDPLVMYKSRATELFGNLLSEIREAVISRMFVFQPRRTEATGQETQVSVSVQPGESQVQPEAVGNKKKRHRH